MVENSINLCNPISGWFFRHWTIRTGHLFPKRGSFRMLLRAPSASSWRHDTATSSGFGGSQAEAGGKGHESTSLAVHPRFVFPAAIAGVRLCQTFATSLLRLYEPHTQCFVRTHKMVVSPPPLQMGQQVRRLLSRGPGAACESSHPMSDGQVHPLNESGIEPTREA